MDKVYELKKLNEYYKTIKLDNLPRFDKEVVIELREPFTSEQAKLAKNVDNMDAQKEFIASVIVDHPFKDATELDIADLIIKFSDLYEDVMTRYTAWFNSASDVETKKKSMK